MTPIPSLLKMLIATCMREKWLEEPRIQIFYKAEESFSKNNN